MRQGTEKETQGSARVALAVLLCLAVLAAGCAGRRQPAQTSSPGPDWSEQTAGSVLSRLQANRASLGTVSAYFSLSLASPPPGQPSSMQGLLTVRFREGPPLARIQVLRPFGGVALDMVLDGQELAVFVPGQKTLYRGEPAQLDEAGQGPGELFRFGLAGPAGLKTDGAELSVGEEAAVITLSNGRLELDKQTGWIRFWRTDSRRMIYSDYVQVGKSAWLPGRIRLQSASGEPLAECRLEDVQTVQDTEEVFDLSGYSPEKTGDLEELFQGQR